MEGRILLAQLLVPGGYGFNSQWGTLFPCTNARGDVQCVSGFGSCVTRTPVGPHPQQVAVHQYVLSTTKEHRHECFREVKYGDKFCARIV